MRIARHMPVTLAVLAGFLVAAPSVAQDREWIVVPYLWGADTSLDVRVQDDPVFGGDLAFSDLVDQLDLALQLHVETRKDRFGLLFDITYRETSDTQTTSITPLPGSTEIATDADLAIFEAGGFYRASGESHGWDFMLGVRAVELDAELTLTPPDPLSPRVLDSSSSITDGFAGIRYIAPLGDRWSVVLRGDAGTGDSDLSLNLVALLGYRFGETDRYNLLFGYRHFALELEETNDGLSIDTEVTMSGPQVGFAFRF